MNNIFNDDFRDFISSLNKYEVEYILVGGYAVILHGYRRTTGYMDIWVNNTKENYKKLIKACTFFGIPTHDIVEEIFLSNKGSDVFTFGRSPVSIDIMKQLKGCNFTEAYATSKIYMEENLPIRFLHLSSLITSKKAAGRYKDLDDIEKLNV